MYRSTSLLRGLLCNSPLVVSSELPYRSQTKLKKSSGCATFAAHVLFRYVVRLVSVHLPFPYLVRSAGCIVYRFTALDVFRFWTPILLFEHSLTMLTPCIYEDGCVVACAIFLTSRSSFLPLSSLPQPPPAACAAIRRSTCPRKCKVAWTPESAGH